MLIQSDSGKKGFTLAHSSVWVESITAGGVGRRGGRDRKLDDHISSSLRKQRKDSKQDQAVKPQLLSLVAFILQQGSSS